MCVVNVRRVAPQGALLGVTGMSSFRSRRTAQHHEVALQQRLAWWYASGGRSGASSRSQRPEGARERHMDGSSGASTGGAPRG